MAFSMAASIGICVWVGMKWDEHAQWDVPMGALTGGLLGTVMSMWLVIKELSK